MTENPKTRASLILRLKDSQDVQAWQDFAEIYQPVIFSLAKKRGLQDADAHDLTQEVLTRVAKSIDRWNPDPSQGTFRGWLATITRNLVIETFRKNNRLPATTDQADFVKLAEQNPSGPETMAFDLEQERQVFAWAANKARGRFEDRTWQAFWLTAVEGVEVNQVATELELTRGAVYVARSRVMAQLRKIIQQSQFDSFVGEAQK